MLTYCSVIKKVLYNIKGFKLRLLTFISNGAQVVTDHEGPGASRCTHNLQGTCVFII